MNGVIEKAREAVKSAARMAPLAEDPSNINSVDISGAAVSGFPKHPSNMPPQNPDSHTDYRTDRLAFGDDSVLLDPELIKAARHIYRTFYEVHPEVVQQPIGVAIGRLTRRGKLVFGDKPVLLPQECFVPFSQIEPGLV